MHCSDVSKVIVLAPANTRDRIPSKLYRESIRFPNKSENDRRYMCNTYVLYSGKHSALRVQTLRFVVALVEEVQLVSVTRGTSRTVRSGVASASATGREFSAGIFSPRKLSVSDAINVRSALVLKSHGQEARVKEEIQRTVRNGNTMCDGLTVCDFQVPRAVTSC